MKRWGERQKRLGIRKMEHLTLFRSKIPEFFYGETKAELCIIGSLLRDRIHRNLYIHTGQHEMGTVKYTIKSHWKSLVDKYVNNIKRR